MLQNFLFIELSSIEESYRCTCIYAQQCIDIASLLCTVFRGCSPCIRSATWSMLTSVSTTSSGTEGGSSSSMSDSRSNPRIPTDLSFS